MRIVKLASLALFFSLVLLTAGCPKHATVADIQRDPGKYMNKEVAISGNVTNSFGALGSGAYEIDDGTGKMWVLSESYGVPSNGAHVNVVGNLVNSITFGGRSFANAIRQTKRR
jgi:hypothetical protein